MISHERAVQLLNEHLKTKTTLLHCREVEVIMEALAKHFGENEHEWGLAGLLHDLDCDIEKSIPKNQGITAADILAKEGVSEAVLHAIKAHNEELTGVKRESRLDFALSAADSISGIIYAAALVYPDKKIASVKPSSILKRMKDERFAASVRRDRIKDCEKCGILLEEFACISLEAMKNISAEIGL